MSEIIKDDKGVRKGYRFGKAKQITIIEDDTQQPTSPFSIMRFGSKKRTITFLADTVERVKDPNGHIESTDFFLDGELTASISYTAAFITFDPVA